MQPAEKEEDSLWDLFVAHRGDDKKVDAWELREILNKLNSKYTTVYTSGGVCACVVQSQPRCGRRVNKSHVIGKHGGINFMYYP